MLASWLTDPGDFEVWLGNKVQNRLTEREGPFLLSFWRLDNHYVLVDFRKEVVLGRGVMMCHC